MILMEKILKTKKMKKISVKIAVLLISALAGFLFVKAAIGANTENSLLWKIEGNGIKTSYIYGTFHMMNKSDFAISDQVKKAFLNSEVLVCELDMDDPNLQQKMVPLMGMSNNTLITELTTKEEQKAIDEALTKQFGTGLQAFNNLKPFMIVSMLIPTIMDEEVASYELEFVKLAQEQKKEVLGLETVEEQMTVFDNISYKSQAEDLVEMILEREKMISIFKEMTQSYKNQDINGLYEMIAEQYEDAEEIDFLLTNRNKNWQERIPKMAAEQNVFFAVGAGHLGGEFGILNLLQEMGFTFTPIK